MEADDGDCADGGSMVSEERERVGNLPVNVFPILAEGGAGPGEVFNVLTSGSIGESNQSQS